MSSPTKTRYAVLVDHVLGAVMAALVLGFFLMLWQGYNSLSDSMTSHEAGYKELRAKIEATGTVTSEEIAKLRTGIRRLEETLLDMRDPEELLANDDEDRARERHL
jgi:hypothetical protein